MRLEKYLLGRVRGLRPGGATLFQLGLLSVPLTILGDELYAISDSALTTGI